MKILITYPSISSNKGTPLLSQNRQFQYFNQATYIYPVVPAQAATLLKQAGHTVLWLDCIAQGWSYTQFLDFIKSERPDLIAFETKTPVVKEHWKIIDDIKNNTGGQVPKRPVPKLVLFGDHVTALPEESFKNSKVDYVLTGGDYDTLLLNLANVLSKSLTSREFEPGIYYREDGQIKNTGKFQLCYKLDQLPFIDRDLTKWQLYAYNNGNYKRTPGAYIMSGRDCWWGKCTFCSWTTLYPHYRIRSVNNVLDEIGMLIQRYNVREVMDDAGSIPAGQWLRDFCKGMIERGYNQNIYLDCNMRFGALDFEDFKLMKKANFRLLLLGLESSNQNTLDRINKNLKVDRIITDCKLARKAGLFPHITIMFGYPWETYQDAKKTLELGLWLLKKGYAYTMQATMVVPYPGSPLFNQCKEEGLLRSLDWNDYAMKHPIMKSPIPDEKIKELVQGMYKVSFQPEFLIRKLLSVKDVDDLKYALRAGKKVLGHIFDFGHKKSSNM